MSHPNPSPSVTQPTNERLGRTERLNALVHLYRGELARSTDWRMRLDTTTNWAIAGVSALGGLSLSDLTLPAWVCLLGFPPVLVFHTIEARRWRTYTRWRRRARLLEGHLYTAVLRGEVEGLTGPWAEALARDLSQPRLAATTTDALLARLRANYLPIYLGVVVLWALKVGRVAADLPQFVQAAGIGPLPGPVVIASLALICVGLLLAASRAEGPEGPLDPDALTADLHTPFT
jgi:uncharacterized membrane protein